MSSEWVVLHGETEVHESDPMKRRAKRLVRFMTSSVTPFHAVENCKRRLAAAGFEELIEGENWQLEPSKAYYTTRNESTLLAFAIGGKFVPGKQGGFKAIGTHTDSPVLKIRPISKQQTLGYLQVGVELYGGLLAWTWWDRDLTVGGRIFVKDENGVIQSRLVNVGRPILRISSLPPHLQTAEDKAAFKFNPETQLHPVIATALKAQLGVDSVMANGTTVMESSSNSAISNAHHPILLEVVAEAAGCRPEDIVDIDLNLFDAVPPTLLGAREEFVVSARLDNLVSTFCAVDALADLVSSEQGRAALAADSDIWFWATFDNEEVGSSTMQGAASSIMETTLNRIVQTTVTEEERPADAFEATMRRSFLLSVDVCHAVNPSYVSYFSENFRPMVHSGVVIKENASQRYATDGASCSLIRELAQRNNVPIQLFCVRNDSPCGSTIGPLISTRTGIKTIDMGIPLLSMHSIREMCGVDDVTHQVNLFTCFLTQFRDIAHDILSR